MAGLYCFVPGFAYAQNISGWVFVGILSPVLMIGFAITIGFLTTSWRNGFSHAGLVVIWVALFWVASVCVTNDYIIWTPLALYFIHGLIMLGLVIALIWKSMKG